MVKITELNRDNPKSRLDSQFFDPNTLDAIGLIERVGGVRLAEVTGRVLKGRTVPYSEDGSVKIIRSGDISRSVNDTTLLRSSAEESIFFLRNGDVLVSSIGFGSIGKIHLFQEGEGYGTVSEVTVIRQNSVRPAYLAAFLLGHFGQCQIERQITGATGQLHLYADDLGRIHFPNQFPRLEAQVAEIFARSIACQKAARTYGAEADAILLGALGLRDWSPPEPLAYTRSVAAVFNAKRFDANYFAPKYEAALNHIKDTGSGINLGNGLTSLVSRGKQPIYSSDGMPVVNSKHVRANRVVLDADNRKAEPTKLCIRFGDVLINGTGVGTIGRAAPYLERSAALPDNHVTIVRPSGIDALYLSVFLNSKLGQMQIEQMISGSSGQIEIYPDDIRQIVVWDAPPDIQSKIADCIRNSFKLEQQSDTLLAIATRAVEVAIEDSEAAALVFIREAQDAPST